MPAKQTTTSMTEADLEARFPGAIQRAFPWMPDGAIKHQIKFTFKFGRQTLEANSGKTRAEARLDVLLKLDGTNLAVMEFKKPGLELTDDDGAQGLSYARLVEPPAPLVVVTNGKDVRFIETHTGKPWTPTTKSAKALGELVTNASRVAEGDLRLAVDTLMRTAPDVWMQAVRVVSARTLEELTASPSQPALPFDRYFLTPRAATHRLLMALDTGARLLILEGTPFAGKSNVLRELFLRTARSTSTATMFIEAGIGRGALQAVADALGTMLGWPLTPQEARDWLVRVSNHEDKRLVLAFDGLRVTDESTVRDIEDLSSGVFGPSLALVVAVDEDVSKQLLMSTNARTLSPIGRRAQTVRVGQLTDSEFNLATRVLEHNRILLMAGADMAPEYREPWILRATAGPVFEVLKSKPQNRGVTLPASLGLRLIHLTRRRFSEDTELLRRFRGLAHAMVADAQNQPRPPELILQQLELGVIRRNAVEEALSPEDVKWLGDNGFIRASINEHTGPTILVRLPELLASETAHVLADELHRRAKDDFVKTAEWLAGAASNLPLGEVVAAQAIVDAAKRRGGVAVGVIDALVNMPPKREMPRGPLHYAGMLPSGVLFDIVLGADGKGYAEIDGERREVDMSADERATYDQIHPWMILSHVAAVRFEVDRDGRPTREDPVLLLQIGTCPAPLRAARGPESLRMLPTKDFPDGTSIVHPSAGVAEPITLGIFDYLASEVDDADAWVTRAASSKSLPLLARIHTALGVLAGFKTHRRSAWAERTLKTTVLPALRKSVDALKPASKKSAPQKSAPKKSAVKRAPVRKAAAGSPPAKQRIKSAPAQAAPKTSMKKAPRKTAARKSPADGASPRTPLAQKVAVGQAGTTTPRKKVPMKTSTPARKSPAPKTAAKKPTASKRAGKKPSRKS